MGYNAEKNRVRLREWLKDKSEEEVLKRLVELDYMNYYIKTMDYNIGKGYAPPEYYTEYTKLLQKIVWGSEVVTKSEHIVKGMKLRDKLKHRDSVINSLEKENKSLKKQIGNKGKKHIRGTKEFYRDVIEANGKVYKKRYKNGVREIYKEAIAYALSSQTICNYCSSNDLEINRINLKNWYAIAIALREGRDPDVSIGVYNSKKGYK